jgi:hypothetical protein
MHLIALKNNTRHIPTWKKAAERQIKDFQRFKVIAVGTA